MNDDQAMTTRPTTSEPRNAQSSGSATIPPPSSTKDAPKVMDKSLIQMRDGRSEGAGYADMVIASFRMK